MEHLDVTVTGVTLAIGALLLYAVPKLIGGSSKESTDDIDDVAQQLDNKSSGKQAKQGGAQKGKKGANNKKKKPANQLAEAKKQKEEAEEKLRAHRLEEAKRREEAEAAARAAEEKQKLAAAAAAEAEAEKAKKDKKKKKNQKAAKPAQESAKPAPAAPVPVAPVKPAAPVEAAAQPVDEDWEVVSRKKKATPIMKLDEEESSGVSTADAKVSSSIDVGEFGPLLIGPGGVRITAIQQESGAHVSIAKGTSICTITGTADQVDHAKRMVFEIVGSQGTEVIDTGAMRVLVFGPGGSTLRKIQQDSGARLDMEKDSSVVTIKGDKNAVNLAKSMIEGILKTSNVSKMQLESKDVASVIGKGGENIRRLTAETGATIDIGEDQSCTISGTPEQVLNARKLVKLYIEHRGPPPEAKETLTIPIDHGRLLIGKKGATINELQNRTHTRITVEHTMAMSTVVIAGSKVDVSACVHEIYKMIEDNSFKEVIPFTNPNLVKVVLGVKGETINRIRDESNARLEISNDSSAVTIIGTKAQVAKAAQMVQAKIAEELGPPAVKKGQKQHTIDLGTAVGKIIGTAGSNIARLEKEYGVSVVIKHGNTCYVTGAPADADKAKKDIDNVLTKHEENMEKARKEMMAQVAVASQKNTTVNDSGVYSGWDVPMDSGSWDAPAGNDMSWNSAPNAQGW